jgi:hypothetical protein
LRAWPSRESLALPIEREFEGMALKRIPGSPYRA